MPSPAVAPAVLVRAPVSGPSPNLPACVGIAMILGGVAVTRAGSNAAVH